MAKIISYTHRFQKQYRKKIRDPRWKHIFETQLPPEIDSSKRTPFDFITDCLINDDPIPRYFYPHALNGVSNIVQQIKRQLSDPSVTAIVLELHFDGHNGDHLLVYVPTDEVVFFVSIGTHSELFG